MDMSLEYIWEQLKIQGEAALTLLNGKGSSLTQNDMILLAVAAAVGVLFCFFGLKMVRFWAALFGLVCGVLGGSYLAAYFGLSGYVPLIIGGIAGIILAVLGARFYLGGVFLVEWILGFLVSAYFLQPNDWISALVCAGIGLVIALIALKFTEPVTMLITAIAGGFLGGQAVYIMIPLKNNMVVHIAVIAVLVILGVIIQFLLESKRRKRQHLKRAEEIRKTYSVANEVDKARAMMENLNGETPVKKGKAPKSGKDSKSEKEDSKLVETDLEDDEDFQILEFPEDEK